MPNPMARRFHTHFGALPSESNAFRSRSTTFVTVGAKMVGVATIGLIACLHERPGGAHPGVCPTPARAGSRSSHRFGAFLAHPTLLQGRPSRMDVASPENPQPRLQASGRNLTFPSVPTPEALKRGGNPFESRRTCGV